MRIALVVLAAALAAGCGSERRAATEPPATALTIDVWPQGRGHGEPRRLTLSCDPAAGSVPDPEAACDLLRRRGVAALAPVPRDVACTQIYGGPEQAEVRGSVRGKQVKTTFSRANGCEIGRWDRVSVLVPRSG